MKKLLFFILLLCSINVFGQPIVYRSGNANTVVDYRWGALYNMYAPRYTDTSSANLQKGIDSCGAIIFVYQTNSLWFRQCSPKKWVEVSGGSGGSQTWQQTLLVSGGSLLTQNNDIDVAGYDFRFSSADEFGVGADSVSISINQALGRFKVTGIPSTDTTLSLVGITANGYLVKTNKSSLRPYTFTNGLTESGGTVKLGGTLTEAATTIDGNQNDLLFTDINEYIVESSVVELNGVSSGSSSSIRLDGQGLYLRPKNFEMFIDSLDATDTTQYIVGYRSNGQLVKTLKSSLGWGLTGNAGTTAGTNFIGTTDSVSLFFKLNGSKWGNLDINQKNLSFGYLALNSVTSTGLRNTVYGSLAGQSLTTSDDNVAIGYSALRQQTAFTKNTAVGAYALDSSISAGGTVSIGYASLQSLSGGTGNTAVGSFALNKLVSNINTAIGYEAAMNTTSNSNTVIGYRALKDNISASETTVVGSQAMINATGGVANSAFGVSALSKTEQGLNTAIGYGSMLNNTAGDQNAAVGYYSLLNNTTGAKNSAFGAGALENNTTGSFNTAVGQDAMLNNTSGFRNIGVGWNAKFGDSSYHNIGIGYAVGSSLTGGGNHDNTFIGGFGTANNINQKVQPVHQIVIGSYAYGTRDYETVIGSDSSKYIKFYAADSAQWIGLDRTTSYSHVLAYDSATGNTRYMPNISISGSPSLSSITAATATNDINNANYGQVWRWNSLTDGVGLTLTSNSTAATGNSMAVLEVSNTGTNADNTQTTATANITSNKISSAGSSIALNVGTNSTSLTNIGGYFSAISGTNNYAIIVPSGGGNVGIGTTTPDSLLTVQNGFWGKRGVRLSGLASSANATDSMLVVNASNGNVGYRAMVTPTNTVTLENKRWKARVGSTTSSGTPTINTDNVDIYKLTAQAADITSFTTNLSGTPNDGDILEIQITGTAARAITWGSSFVSSTVTLPTTTVTTATLTVVVQYFTTSSYGNNKWVCVNSF